MLKQLRKRTEGFTIIEVMIVLAIAGLILLIVFLAVPALQRNSRNTSLRNTAANVLGAVNEYVSANNGQLPDTGACSTVDTATGDLTIEGTNPVQAKIKAGIDVNCDGSMPIDTGDLISIGIGMKCNPEGNDFEAGTPRALAAGYDVETGGGQFVPQCVES